MDAVEFWKTIDRLCRAKEDCSSCPLNGYACDVNLKDVARYYTLESVQEMVQKVEQWAKDHPAKTRQSEFLKMFPKAEIKDDALWMCPKYISYDYRPEENCYEISCSDCKHKFWLEEVTDND